VSPSGSGAELQRRVREPTRPQPVVKRARLVLAADGGNGRVVRRPIGDSMLNGQNAYGQVIGEQIGIDEPQCAVGAPRSDPGVSAERSEKHYALRRTSIR
jgi:hypothetical protein